MALPPIIGGGPIVPPTQPPLPPDCSPNWQAFRWWLLWQLQQKFYSGVQSVSDRSRSVNYRDMDGLLDAINDLKNQIAACEDPGAGAGPGGRLSSGRRIFFSDLNKWL